MYSFFLDTDGTVDFRRGNAGRWEKDESATGIKYAVNAKSLYYDIEVAIPWSLFGKDGAPVGQLMAMALEIVNKEEYVRESETIPDVDNDASWTWMEFRLLPGGGSGVAEAQVADDSHDVTTVVSGGTLMVKSAMPMNRVSVYTFDGKMLSDKVFDSTMQEIPLPALAGGGVLRVLFEDGNIVCKKVLRKKP